MQPVPPTLDPYADDAEQTDRPDRRPAIVALVVGLLAVALAVALQPSVVRGGAGSVQAVAIAVAAGLVFAGFVALAFRFVRQPLVLAAVVGAPLLIVAGSLAFAALVDDEADDEVAQQLVTDLAATEGDDTGEAPDEGDEASEPATPAGPVRLGTGTFQGLDNHAGRGTVSLVEQPDGSQVVLFEDFEVERGPDYHVYLVAGQDVFDASAGVSVGALQGNVGDQQYPVPDELVGEQPLTVLIWCRAFDTNIAGTTV